MVVSYGYLKRKTIKIKKSNIDSFSYIEVSDSLFQALLCKEYCTVKIQIEINDRGAYRENTVMKRRDSNNYNAT